MLHDPCIAINLQTSLLQVSAMEVNGDDSVFVCFFLTMHFQFTVTYAENCSKVTATDHLHIHFRKSFQRLGQWLQKNQLQYTTTALWIFVISKSKESALLKSNLDTDC